MVGANKVSPSESQNWPKLIELLQIMEEQTMEKLNEVTGDKGAKGLCERLGTDMLKGLPNPILDKEERIQTYGVNEFEEKKATPFYAFICDALKDFIILLLLFMAVLEFIIKGLFGKDQQEKTEAFAESAMLVGTVMLITLTSATMEWKRERMFLDLQEKYKQSNMAFVVRNGEQMSVTHRDICVGDVLSFNAHNASNLMCDGVFLSGQDVKCDESALTGEPEPIGKSEDKPFMISGTIVNAGKGTCLVVAVGDNSIAGKIKKAVYGAEDAEPSPLYGKLEKMAKQIGMIGMVGASLAVVAMLVHNYAVRSGGKASELLNIAMFGLGTLACSIPEGLPLALVIALALTSGKMSHENNLVKQLRACETMGSATTICTDKTGTLTTNRMTVRACYMAGKVFDVQGAEAVGPRLKESTEVDADTKKLFGDLVCCCTMDESGFRYDMDGVIVFQGNPTECALLKMSDELGLNYSKIRADTPGRSAETLSQGSSKVFTSARKMMSWIVPRPDGGYRVYAKGASEIIMTRVTNINTSGAVREITEEDLAFVETGVIGKFADLAMRTIGLAYKDVDKMDSNELSEHVLNTDGSPAFVAETGLTLLGVVGIEDPLRPEVAPAIQRCYKAGIDVRMVTGDNLATAIAIAKGAGILDAELHFDESAKLKPKRAMEGKVFRRMVHDYDDEGVGTFNQAKFDEVWPYLRVLARSSPDDKLTLAKGLNGSKLYEDKEKCAKLLANDKIRIFPDRQVVAMTGDGTNDAPALKNADVGFAMGIAGTQIAKDAADIILLDDNFASIVVAAKWGRNVCQSIQKFLQFQLTVNITILSLNVVCAVVDIPPPLGVLQLLWVNVIMDSFASIALASEPPRDELLERPPINRNDSIITTRMFINMFGMSAYQLTVILILIYQYEWLPDLKADIDDPITGYKSRHYTVLFNIFIFFQVFNEYNARMLEGEWKIWEGLSKNKLYLFISVFTVTFQVVMVQFAAPLLTHALKVHPKGLSATQWGLCLLFGASTLIVRQVVNVMCFVVNSICARRRGGSARQLDPISDLRSAEPVPTPERTPETTPETTPE